MERYFRLNWPLLVEEAKQRRKSQKLTQARLAKLAGVSTPTVSRFESGATDIELPSALSILAMLGMTDQRTLKFHDAGGHDAVGHDAGDRYDFARMIVVFVGRDGDKRVSCAISQEVLEDHFNGEHKDPLKVFATHRNRIEYEARRKYLTGQTEADGSILLNTDDFYI